MTSQSREDYLKQILLQQQQAGPGQAVSMGKVAEQMGVAGASVTGMVKSLVDEDLVEYEPYHGVRLTRKGERRALSVIRRHRLIEQFLVQTLGLDWTAVHEEAERLEHAISDRLLDRIDAYLGHPSVDPHGDPIPGPSGQLRQPPLLPLSRCEAGRRVRVVRVTDQATPFLQYVDRIGLRPGADVTITSVDPPAETITLAPAPGNGASVTLAITAAAKLMVEAF